MYTKAKTLSLGVSTWLAVPATCALREKRLLCFLTDISSQHFGLLKVQVADRGPLSPSHLRHPVL